MRFSFGNNHFQFSKIFNFQNIQKCPNCIVKSNRNNTFNNQNKELLKFNHYFDQNRMEKKDGGNKTNYHKEKENGSERDGNQQSPRSNKIPRKNNNLATENNIRQLPTVVITE